MATLIQQDFDLFSIAGHLADTTVRIPHGLADMFRNMSRQERDGNEMIPGIHNKLAFRVPLIKYLRSSIKDSAGHVLGLKDAKDIVDHYYETRDEQRPSQHNF